MSGLPIHPAAKLPCRGPFPGRETKHMPAGKVHLLCKCQTLGKILCVLSVESNDDIGRDGCLRNPFPNPSNQPAELVRSDPSTHPFERVFASRLKWYMKMPAHPWVLPEIEKSLIHIPRLY